MSTISLIDLAKASIYPVDYTDDWIHYEYRTVAAEVYWRWHEPGHLHINYAGTNGTVLDWCRNALACRFRGMHAGFLSEFLFTYRSSLRSAVREAEQISISGYSQGGGVAQIAQWELYKLYGKIAQCTVFGSPRAFSAGTVRSIPESLICSRYVNGHDIVCRLPPKMLGYASRGTKIRIRGRYTGPILAHYQDQYWIALERYIS